MRQLKWLLKVPAFLALWVGLATFMGLAGLVFGARPLWPAVIAQSGLIMFGVAIGGRWFTGTRPSTTAPVAGEPSESNAPGQPSLRKRRSRIR
jgi:hypothetical protein